MDISWYGHSCFRITERGATTIVTDPYADSIGYGELNLKADVVTVSHDMPGHANVDGVRDWQFVVKTPGEYEVGGVFIIGSAMIDKKAENPRYNIVYTYDYGNLNVVHLGDLDHVPTQSALEALGEVNVLMVPVGGGTALNSAQAAEVVSMLEPNIVLPMHYQTPHSLLELAPLERFLKEMGISNPVEEETLRVSASTLPEQTQVVVLGYRIG